MQLIFDEAIGEVERALLEAQSELRYCWAAHLARRPSARCSGEDIWQSGTTPMDLVFDEIVRRHLRKVEHICAVIVSEDADTGTPSPGTDAFLVDALDGTHNALAGYPMYTSSVALYQDHDWRFGWVYDVSRDVAYVAARGQGSYVKTPLLYTRLRVNPPASVGQLAVSLMRSRRPECRHGISELLWQARKVRMSSCSSIDLCLVAAGALDAFVDIEMPGHERTCDIAAAALILTEAGGDLFAPELSRRILTPPSDNSLRDFGPLIAVSNRSVAIEIAKTMSLRHQIRFPALQGENCGTTTG